MDILLAWIASISSGVEPLVLKASSKQLIRSPWLFNVLWIGSAFVFVIPFALIVGASFPASWSTFVWLGFWHAAFFLLYTSSLYKLDASAMAPLFSLRIVFALGLSVLVLHESFSAPQLLLVALIVLALPLAFFDETRGIRAFKHRSVLLAVVAMLALAVAGYYTNIAYGQNGFATTVLWQDVFTFLFLLPSLWFVDWRKEQFTPKTVAIVGVLAVLGFIYIAATAAAYGNAYGLTSVIVSLPLSMIFVWLMSRKYPGWLEHQPPDVYRVRFTGAAIMVTAAILLSALSAS